LENEKGVGKCAATSRTETVVSYTRAERVSGRTQTLGGKRGKSYGLLPKGRDTVEDCTETNRDAHQADLGKGGSKG